MSADYVQGLKDASDALRPLLIRLDDEVKALRKQLADTRTPAVHPSAPWHDNHGAEMGSVDR